MDKLNKLRLLAGVPVRYTPSAPKKLMEAAPQPVAQQTRARPDLANKAAMHLNQAIKALNELNASAPRKNGKAQINESIDTQALVDVLNTILENLGQGFEIDPPADEDEHIQDPSEFAELSADADAAAYGEMGGEEDVTSPEVVAKIAAYAKEAGFGAEEGLGDEELGDVADDALVGDERTMPDDLGDDEFADDEFDGPGEPLPDADLDAEAGMEDPGYGEDDGEFAEFDEAAPAITDKNESPNQLDHLEPSPTDDHDRKVSVPASVKQALRDQAATARKEAKELGVADKDAKWFYENLAKMFEELLGHLDGGTVLDIKKAQIFMSSLMGPMLHKIPAEVVSFVAKGGAERTLKDYMKPVDKKYPVTGKLYKGE